MFDNLETEFIKLKSKVQCPYCKEWQKDYHLVGFCSIFPASHVESMVVTNCEFCNKIFILTINLQSEESYKEQTVHEVAEQFKGMEEITDEFFLKKFYSKERLNCASCGEIDFFLTPTGIPNIAIDEAVFMICRNCGHRRLELVEK